jgi:hypothetical protein
MATHQRAKCRPREQPDGGEGERRRDQAAATHRARGRLPDPLGGYRGENQRHNVRKQRDQQRHDRQHKRGNGQSLGAGRARSLRWRCLPGRPAGAGRRGLAGRRRRRARARGSPSRPLVRGVAPSRWRVCLTSGAELPVLVAFSFAVILVLAWPRAASPTASAPSGSPMPPCHRRPSGSCLLARIGCWRPTVQTSSSARCAAACRSCAGRWFRLVTKATLAQPGRAAAVF